MKLATPTNCKRAAGFTLVEVLAALMLLAIVIPTAVEALHVATRAGEVAARKGAAARVADSILNNSIVMTNWNGGGTQNGVTTEGAVDYRWTLTSQTWQQDSMKLLTVTVQYPVQGQNYSVTMSTLANSQLIGGTMTTQ